MACACGGGCPGLAALALRVAALEAGRGPRRFSQADRESLAAVFPAIGGAIGSEAFTVAALAALPAAGLQVALQRCSTRRLGRLFARAVGQNVDGFTVQRLGREGSAVIWKLVRVVGDVSDVCERQRMLATRGDRA